MFYFGKIIQPVVLYKGPQDQSNISNLNLSALKAHSNKNHTNIFIANVEF